jgi:hypothetical protein
MWVKWIKYKKKFYNLNYLDVRDQLNPLMTTSSEQPTTATITGNTTEGANPPTTTRK